MKHTDKPKVILNEGYIDLRNLSGNKLQSKRSKTWTKNSSTEFKTATETTTNFLPRFPSKENELVNTGLKKLISSYNGQNNVPKLASKSILIKKCISRERSMFVPKTQKADTENHDFKSKSALSVTTPIRTASKPMDEKKDSSRVLSKLSLSSKLEPLISDFTLTKAGSQEKTTSNEKSLEELLNLVEHDVPSKMRIYDQPHWKDSRLAEKYSVLKVPWRRTYTLPVFSKPSLIIKDHSKPQEFMDRKTYLYDDGTEVDSIYTEKNKSNLALQNHFMIMLFVCGTICGIVLVSLIIWCVFGIEFLQIIAKPKVVNENFIKRYAKYIGGSIIYFITSVFKTISRAFSIPTQRVFQSAQEYEHWPALHNYH